MSLETGPVDQPQAGIARRLAASLYELLLLGALAVAIGLILLPLIGTDADHAGGALTLPGRGARTVSFVCLFAVFGAYCIWLWSGGRRTLPMRTWGLALMTSAGAAVSPGRAAVRYVAGWIGPASAIAAYVVLRPYGQGRWALTLLAVNYAWALVDRDRRFLHDRVAGTRLVRADSARRRPSRAAPLAR
ncbi:MAG TPA: RDD family protein [Casimicrobiaceae bacterium]|nr:RDD family protein [Casimicrobiaceae bacterium]